MYHEEKLKTKEDFKSFKSIFSEFQEVYDDQLQEELGSKLNPLVIVNWQSTVTEEIGEAPLIILN